MLNYFKWYAFQVLVSPCKDVFELLQCRNFSLGLMTKARACKGACQEGSPGVTSHVLGSVGKCKGMNPHTPK